MAEQAVVVGDNGVVELDGANIEEIDVIRKITQQRPAKDRHVARRGDMGGIVEPIGIDEVRFVHAEPLRRRVHFVGKGFDGPVDALGDHHGDVVGRLHHQHLERIVEGHQRARRKAHFRGRHAGGAHGHGERSVHRQAPIAHRLQRDIGRHQLRQRSGIPGLGRLILDERLAAVGIDDEKGSRSGDFGGSHKRKAYHGDAKNRPFRPVEHVGSDLQQGRAWNDRTKPRRRRQLTANRGDLKSRPALRLSHRKLAQS